MLFELRGLSRAALHTELAKSPLGIALSAELIAQNSLPTPVTSYYTKPKLIAPDAEASLKEFWQGSKLLPKTAEAPHQISVPAILVKKQGDFPPFWHKDGSFITAIEELYERVRTKNRELL